MILLCSLLLLTVTEVIPDSTSHAKMVSMYENALERHPENDLENPAINFFHYFETPTPFYKVLHEKILSHEGIKKGGQLNSILTFALIPSSELIVGEILNYHEDSAGSEYYNKRCYYRKVYEIRVDTVFMGDIEKGEKITVRNFEIGGPDSKIFDYPYMRGDTVLAFLKHFPSLFCSKLRKGHRNDIGYKTPFYVSGVMFWVTSTYFSGDSLNKRETITKGPRHVTYHMQLERWKKPFDYQYSEVLEKLGKYTRWIKEWQKKWYKEVTPELLDSLILNPSIQPGKTKIVQQTVQKAILK